MDVAAPDLPVDPLDVLRKRRSAKWQTYPPDVLPLTVAEMDFALAAPGGGSAARGGRALRHRVCDGHARAGPGAGRVCRHARLNFATSDDILDQATARMALSVT